MSAPAIRTLDPDIYPPPAPHVDSEPDEGVRQRRYHAKHYPFTTTFLPSREPIGLLALDSLDAFDAINECEHGAMPTDRKFPDGCACWAAVSPEIPDPAPRRRTPTIEEIFPKMPPALPVSTTAPPEPRRAVPPLVVRLVNELDEEIDRLKRARAAMLAAATEAPCA